MDRNNLGRQLRFGFFTVFVTVTRPVTGRLTATAMSASRFDRLKTRGRATICTSSPGLASQIRAMTWGSR